MDTAEARYDALTAEVAALYDADRQADALALMDAAGDLAPWSAEFAHLRACLLGSLGHADQALSVLQCATDAGAWWAEPILTEDDDLADLQQLPEFQELVELSRKRRTTDPTPPLIYLPTRDRPDRPDRPGGAGEGGAGEGAAGEGAAGEGGAGEGGAGEGGASATRVVVALHGAGQRAAHSARDWSAVLDLGCALVCVESSQLMSPMYRTWPDPGAARDDIARALSHLPADLHGRPLIAAGFSAGGRAALDWALTGLPQRADGVLVLAPALRELPRSAANSLSPATILIGADDDLLDTITHATAELTALGQTVRQLPHVAHHPPADFATILGEYLS